jgi:hypothetical protein
MSRLKYIAEAVGGSAVGSLMLVGLFMIALAPWFAGCATATGETPNQRVYGAKVDFLAALAIIEQYESLPRCDEVDIKPCSDRDTVEIIRSTVNAADRALDLSESIVNDPLATEQQKEETAKAAVSLAASVWELADMVREDM